MNLKDKIFIMNDQQPELNPIGIHIPEFQALYEADTTEEKTKYRQELAYIYHMCEYDSPYYDKDNKEQLIVIDFMGRTSWRPNKLVKAAMEKYKSLDMTAEKSTLDSAIAACRSIGRDIERQTKESRNVEKLLDELEKQIGSKSVELLDKVDYAKMKLELEKDKLNSMNSLTNIFSKLDKHIQTLLDLRKKVTTAVYKGENAGSTINANFLIDDLMDELDNE